MFQPAFLGALMSILLSSCLTKQESKSESNAAKDKDYIVYMKNTGSDYVMEVCLGDELQRNNCVEAFLNSQNESIVFKESPEADEQLRKQGQQGRYKSWAVRGSKLAGVGIVWFFAMSGGAAPFDLFTGGAFTLGLLSWVGKNWVVDSDWGADSRTFNRWNDVFSGTDTVTKTSSVPRILRMYSKELSKVTYKDTGLPIVAKWCLPKQTGIPACYNPGKGPKK